MVETKAQGAEPSMNDGLVKYSGSFVNTDAYGNGDRQKFTINTSIRSNIVVFISCKGLNEISGEYDLNIDDPLISYEIINYVYSVNIFIPSGCKCFYRISGSENIASLTVESEKSSNAHDEDPIDWSHGHDHDGNNSKIIPYSSISGTPTIANDFIVLFTIDSTYAYGAFEPYTGVGGFTMPIACKLKTFSYCKDDGIGGVLKNTFTLGTPLAVAANDNLILKFRDDGGTDKVTLYKNGVAAQELGATAGAADPGGIARNVWSLHFSTI